MTHSFPPTRSSNLLFTGIPLDEMSVSMTMNGAVLPELALSILAAEEQGVAPEKLRGTIQNDILTVFMVRNTSSYPQAPSLRLIPYIFASPSPPIPKLHTIPSPCSHIQTTGEHHHPSLAHPRPVTRPN